MYQIPTLEDVRSEILRDIQSLEPTADVEVDSDYYVRASALASCAVGLYAHQNWIVRQYFPDTADSEYLEMHAKLRNIYRKNATYASGSLKVFGTVGSVIQEGLQVKYGELFYLTKTTGVIGDDSSTIVKVTALATGVASNVKAESKALLTAPPVGISTDCLLLSDVTGGTMAESDSSLLARLLERIRRPPSGGNKNDFRQWAESMDGVTSAFVYPLRRGEGTVDIAITSGDTVPSDEIVQATQAYIDEVRPVTAKSVHVLKPIEKKVNFDIKVQLDTDTTLANVKAEIENALSNYFLSLKPADTLILSQIEAVISDLIGVVDREIVQPTRNQTIDAYREMGWFRLGNVNVELM
ncbi:baseplate J/gp47 family protein [Avibacterium sp. 20-129]|uniref:baseplate J/gp47 family protein n=1 Tax=Avibacterium sp. 20-129 TaxID=2911525 RepID=UPI0022459050|nr:baseplate J/gp47 family protein [Avibacterium sp. 20-129]MCW9699708.1 baseplate J/gp47 family protein [Avibacterium sp. 20-129]